MALQTARPRQGRAAPREVSKLRAARQTRISPSALAAGAGLLLLLAAVALLATGERKERVVAAAREILDSRFASLGLTLAVVHLQGASPVAQDEIIKAADLKPGQPILGIDLEALRNRVERVGWVERARVIRLLPDTLVLAVDERPLMAVWEHAGRAMVVAANGSVVSKVRPEHFAALPLIVGNGANLAARDILSALAARPRLASRVSAYVRVDDRRWDLRLKDGTIVELPADGQGAALDRLALLDQKSGILQLGLARIDLRTPEMVVVRPRGVPATAMATGGT